MKTDKFYRISRAWYLQGLLRFPVAALLIHWFAQGMFYMDATERRFKILLDMILTALIASLLSPRLSLLWSVTIAWLTAHTLNFVFNAQIWVVLKHFDMVTHSWELCEEKIKALATRIKAEPSFIYAAVYGSLVRGEWVPTSDLDVRLVRKPGVANGLRACWFVMRERSRALAQRFPLDIYLLDDLSGLSRLRPEEIDNAIILLQE